MPRVTQLVLSFCLIVLLLPQSVLAFAATFNTIPEPYGVYDIDISKSQSYYGELDGYPDTYQFVLESETPVVLSLWSYAGNEPRVQFAGILVREREAGGVAEVARLSAGGEWERVTDSATKVPYLEGPSYADTLSPGTYRFEVSNPENVGQYLVRIGEERAESGYFSTLADIRAVYEFHERSVFGMVLVPYVYLPLGILLLIVLIYFTARYRGKEL